MDEQDFGAEEGLAFPPADAQPVDDPIEDEDMQPTFDDDEDGADE